MRVLGGTLVTVAGVAALAASPALGANQTVNAFGVQFLPSAVEVFQGESVTWTNGGGTHDVTFDDGSFTQPPAPSPDPWVVTRTFTTPGTFRYYCSIHGAPNGIGMSGSVVVSDSPSAGGGGGGGGTSPAGTAPAGTVGAQGQSTPCRSQRNFLIRIRRPRGETIASAQVSVNGRSVKVSERNIDAKVRHVAQVDLRGLTKGTYKVEITVRTSKGRRLRGTRTYQTCAAKLESSALPQL